MKYIWHLLIAVFLISIGTMLMVFAYIFNGTAISGIAIWISFGLILWGIGKGLFAIVAHNEQ